ncbi:DUF2207 domain-containing protein [Mycetocola manganoxydans]|uniref:DUF2207 domain-containing protein n=1 Tax=Mycetocola manganoxydans TaxID=699879 RepID=A0A3L6ZPF8_9MICO|nr:DUF2207 domain-containing protein [Mycetocola manganoxydans]RLP69823.1 DUF2207 domain-containing protein [Mycetocola manganoxydans]GHD50196.1 hypothetical protein GCM10008097_23960 [Mycetocola manganoxydans]
MTLQPRTVPRPTVRSFAARVAASVGIVGAVLAGAMLSPNSAATAAPAIRSDVSDFTFSAFEGEYTLGIDGEGRSTLRAVETFVAEFPDFDQNKGIIRAIPEGYLGVDLHTQIVSVTDADGNPVEYDDGETEDGFVQLALGTDDYVQGTQTYVIEYTQRDAVRAFADTEVDEFYWDAPGVGSEQPFAEAQMRVVVPEELTGALTGAAACYVGEQGSETTCEVSETRGDGATVFSSPESELGPGETFSLAIAFEKGTFVAPEIPSTWPVFTVVPAGVAVVGVGALAAALVLRRKSAGDAPGRGVIVPQYTVPKGLDIFVAAELIGKTAKAMPALLLSLAVRRNLRIIDEGEETVFLQGKKREYRLQFVSDDGASAADLTVLTALFGKKRQPGAIKDLSAKDEKLAKKVQALVAAAPEASVAGGYRVKKRVRGAKVFVLLASFVILGLFGLIIAAAALYGVNAWLALSLMIGLVAAICTYIAATSRKALTAKGAETREYLLGLRDYLALAEADRIAMLQSPSGAERVSVEDAVDPGDTMQMVKFYEKLLPFAVLWGIEKEWAAELARYYEQTGAGPEWYAGSSGFHAAAFTSGLGGFASSSGSTPWSASATASASGGSSGGGFAGGGGGGGGVGGR